MKICKKCGKQTIDDCAAICEACGGDLVKYDKNPSKAYEPTKKTNNPTTTYKPPINRKSRYDDQEFQQFNLDGYKKSEDNYTSRSNYNYNDQGGFAWALLGMIVSPIIALILYAVLKGDYPNRAGSILKGMIIGIVVAVVLVIITCAGSYAFLNQNGYQVKW